MVAVHWDEVVKILIDDFLEDEVQVLNQIEYNKRAVSQAHTMKIATQGGTAHSGGDGPFMNYEKIDLKDVMGIFDDYLAADSRVEKIFKGGMI